MKLNNINNFTFEVGRNILKGENLLENYEFSKNLTIKSIEDEKEKVNFDAPINFSDVKKLFDLEINTDIFNPKYVGEKFALGIKDDKFIELIKSAKNTFDEFSKHVSNMKSQIIDYSIILPDNISTENVIIKSSIEKIEDMIIDSAKEVPVMRLITELNDYKEKLGGVINISEKTIDILNGNGLFDKSILDFPEELTDILKEKKKRLLKNQKL